MVPRCLAAALALAAPILLVPAASIACSTASTGARCVSAPAPALVEAAFRPEAAPPPAVEAGDVLPRGAHSIILNAEYYGLPPVRDGWVYMRVGFDAFRVDWGSHVVLERVTDQAAANF